MNLNIPSFENVIKIDQKMEELEREVQLMEQEFGFSKDLLMEPKVERQLVKPEKQPKSYTTTKPTSTVNTQSKNQQTQQQQQKRYQNLVQIKAEKPVSNNKCNPEISQKWMESFKEKPSLQTFFDKDLYTPIFIDKSDFQIKPRLDSNFDYFDDYMNSYALKA